MEEKKEKHSLIDKFFESVKLLLNVVMSYWEIPTIILGLLIGFLIATLVELLR